MLLNAKIYHKLKQDSILLAKDINIGQQENCIQI